MNKNVDAKLHIKLIIGSIFVVLCSILYLNHMSNKRDSKTPDEKICSKAIEHARTVNHYYVICGDMETKSINNLIKQGYRVEKNVNGDYIVTWQN